MATRIPMKSETFTFDGIPNQRAGDIWHYLNGQYGLTWLRRALRDGCTTPAELAAYKEEKVAERMTKMWQGRDAYWARVKAGE